MPADAKSSFRSKRFDLRRELGSGAFGVVYEAYDRERDTAVALKTLRARDGHSLLRFKREFRALAGVTHRNLVRLYELGAEAEHWYFTMELVSGVDFRAYVVGGPRTQMDGGGSTLSVAGAGPGSRPRRAHRAVPRQPPADPERLRSALVQIAAGLRALHDAGKLHCDIKPSNVLVTGAGRVVLLDFGVLTDLTGGSSSPARHLAGTPLYMSPEQGAGRPLTPASDWYSVGVMLHDALAGRPPFVGAPREVLSAKQQLEASAVRELAPGADPDLAELCDRLLARDPADRPGGHEIEARLSRRNGGAVTAAARAGEGAFVGRDAELQALGAALASTRAGRATVVRLEGPSGFGKSTLMSRFLASAGDATVLAGRCYEHEAVPYRGMDSVVDELSRRLEAMEPPALRRLLPEDAPLLARVFPVLRHLESIDAGWWANPDVVDSQTLRARAFAALRVILERLATGRPLVVAIDDLQWTDADTGALLADLVRPPSPPPLMLVLGYREPPEALAPLGAALEEADSAELTVTERVLGPLAPDEARKLAASLLGDHPAAPALAGAIASECGGNPYFVRELVWFATEGPGRADRIARPPTLEQVVRARVADLPPAALQILELVAVAARPLPFDLVQAAAGMTHYPYEDLAVLRDRHLVLTAGSRTGDPVEVHHDRVRQTVVEDLSPASLATLHRRLARTIELARGDPEAVSIHYAGAGEAGRAAFYAARAAEQAEEALAFERAAALYGRAIELAPGAAEGGRLLRRRGDALARAGRGGEAAGEYLAAAKLAGPTEALDLERRAAEQYLISGRIDRGLEVVDQLTAALGIPLPGSPARALLALVGARARLRLRGTRFTERAESQLSAEELLRIDTCYSVAMGLSVVDTVRGAFYQSRNLLLALEAGEPSRVARALGLEVAYGNAEGGRARRRTEALIERAREVTARVSTPYATAYAALAEGIAAHLVGEYPRAYRHCSESERILRERCTGVAYELANAHYFMSNALIYMGELAELSRRLPAIIDDAVRRGDLYAEAQLRCQAMYLVQLCRDEPGAAAAELRRGLSGWSEGVFHMQHAFESYARGEILLYRGHGAEALRVARETWQPLRASRLSYVQYVRHEVCNLHGRAALAAGHGREALRQARAIEREKMGWSMPLARLIRAGVASGRGRRAEALALLDEAERGFAAARMGLYRAAVWYRRAELLGGDEGARLAGRAADWMRAQHIRNPARMIEMLAPR